MTGSVIRAATVADAPAIVALIADVAAEDRWILTELPFDREARTARLAAALRAGHARVLVAEHDGAIAGECTLFVRERVAVVALCVRGDLRGRGVGRALLTAVIAAPSPAGIEALQLDVYAHNAAAIGLYASLGFVEHGPREQGVRRNGDRWEVLTMRRPLDARDPERS
jgi:ribosomal protein S18 acetylase RimI-like enzyme